MGAHVFQNCTALKQVYLGRNIASVPEHAFANCTSLEQVSVLGGAKEIGRNAFYRCTSLRTATLAEGVTSIANYAFYGCTALEQVRLPDTLTAIGEGAFKGDAALLSVTIGANVAQMGQNAFYGCNALTLYCAGATRPEGWNALFNSSFRPVFWGCTVYDGAVMNIAAGAPENPVAIGGICAPWRAGYALAGWSTSSGGEAQIANDGLVQALSEGTVYAVWAQQDN